MPCNDSKMVQLRKLNAHLDCTEESIMETMRKSNLQDYGKIVAQIEEREKTRCMLHDLHINIYK